MEKISAQYNEAVQLIKSAIVENQLEAAKAVNRQMLALYYGIGKYVSDNTRRNVWGTNAIETISQQLKRELPGLRGFSATSIKKMRQFYEQWSELVNRPPSAVDLQNTDNQPLLHIKDLQKMIIRNLVLTPRRGNELIAHGIAMGNWILP